MPRVLSHSVNWPFSLGGFYLCLVWLWIYRKNRTGQFFPHQKSYKCHNVNNNHWIFHDELYNVTLGFGNTCCCYHSDKKKNRVKKQKTKNKSLTRLEAPRTVSGFSMTISVVTWPSTASVICSTVQLIDGSFILNQLSAYQPIRNQTYFFPYSFSL